MEYWVRIQELSEYSWDCGASVERSKDRSGEKRKAPVRTTGAFQGGAGDGLLSRDLSVGVPSAL